MAKLAAQQIKHIAGALGVHMLLIETPRELLFILGAYHFEEVLQWSETSELIIDSILPLSLAPFYSPNADRAFRSHACAAYRSRVEYPA